MASKRACGVYNHHDSHEWSGMDGMDWDCPGVGPAPTLKEALRRLALWSKVESLPAQNEFDDIMADINRLSP